MRVLNWPIVHHPTKQIAITQRRATKASPGGLKGFPRGTFVGGCVRSTSTHLYVLLSYYDNVINARGQGDKYITQIRAIKAPKASRKGFSRVCCELYLSFPSYLCATETKAHDDDEIMSIAIGLPASSYLTDSCLVVPQGTVATASIEQDRLIWISYRTTICCDASQQFTISSSYT